MRIIERDDYAVFRCPPTLNGVMSKAGAYLDRDESGWVLARHRVEQAVIWLEDHGHTVLQARDATGPHRLAPGQCPCGETGCSRGGLSPDDQETVNVRGMTEVWAAWHRAQQ